MAGAESKPIKRPLSHFRLSRGSLARPRRLLREQLSVRTREFKSHPRRFSATVHSVATASVRYVAWNRPVASASTPKCSILACAGTTVRARATPPRAALRLRRAERQLGRLGAGLVRPYRGTTAGTPSCSRPPDSRLPTTSRVRSTWTTRYDEGQASWIASPRLSRSAIRKVCSPSRRVGVCAAR